MNNINPYLHFMGEAEEAMIFYKSVFGGEFTIFQRYADVPGSEKMAAHERGKMIHISLTFGNGITIMATDILDSMGRQLISGNNYHIHIQAESEAEADRLFAGLASGGKVDMPMNKTFWGAYFGMCHDKFGIYWMINYTNTQHQ